jgi:hypothetical protein
MSSTGNYELQYHPHASNRSSQASLNHRSLTDEEVKQNLAVEGVLGESDEFVASKLEIREDDEISTGKNEAKGRIVLIAQNGSKYRVYGTAPTAGRIETEGKAQEDVEMSQEV